MSLRTEVAQWDRKSKDFISDVFNRHREQPGFLASLADMLDDTSLQSGATWLLKHHFDEGGGPPDENLLTAIYRKSPGLVSWEARLHVLQCISKMPVPESQMSTVESFVRQCLNDDAKFVRAWAYSGFSELARQFPEFRAEAVQILNDALAFESAGSVLARVRRELHSGI